MTKASELELGWLATGRRWLPTRQLAAKNPGCCGPNSLLSSTPRIGRALAQRQLEKYPDAIASGCKNFIGMDDVHSRTKKEKEKKHDHRYPNRWRPGATARNHTRQQGKES